MSSRTAQPCWKPLRRVTSRSPLRPTQTTSRSWRRSSPSIFSRCPRLWDISFWSVFKQEQRPAASPTVQAFREKDSDADASAAGVRFPAAAGRFFFRPSRGKGLACSLPPDLLAVHRSSASHRATPQKSPLLGAVSFRVCSSLRGAVAGGDRQRGRDRLLHL